MRCADCKFFEKNERNLPADGFGHCSRWKHGYHHKKEGFKPNDVLVEDDEGWGNAVGPEFGCVLFERRE